jgi:hypothetical protein
MFYSSSIGISNTVARVLLGIASQKLNRLDELQYTNDIVKLPCYIYSVSFPFNRSYLVHTLISLVPIFFCVGVGVSW